VVQGVSPQFKPQCHKRNLSPFKFLDNRVEIIVACDFIIFLIDHFGKSTENSSLFTYEL
jgi:hypothetical protein